jgi:hypothetical protein
LTELHRFTDPTEAAATLTLREGKPEALDFYLHRGRVHVGDIATTTHDAFAAWVSDRAAGLDTIMLAPTRKLVAELNRQARDHLLGGHPPAREVRLADGNQASVGDVIITRSNDRRLRLAPTDWVSRYGHRRAATRQPPVWRAANGVDPQDRRATGPDQLQISSAEWQRHLERRITHASDNPTNSDVRTQEVGFTFQVRRDKARQHWPGPSANNRRSGPPRLGR